MAIESLRDWIFSSKSDVWSFGVVLWEIFSLAKVPYAGLIVDDEFLRRLENGFRMDKPELAPNFIGQLMTECWKSEPHQRPTFNQISQSLSAYIEASLCANYLQMDAKQQFIEINNHKNILSVPTNNEEIESQL